MSEQRDKEGRFITGHRCLTRTWSEKDEALLKLQYPIKTIHELEELFKDKKRGHIKSKARVLGLRKTREILSRIFSESCKNPNPWAKGKKLPKETREKIREGLLRYYEEHDGVWKGKKHSEKTKKKTSEKLKGRRRGKLNPIWKPGVMEKASSGWFNPGNVPWNRGLGNPNPYGYEFNGDLKEFIRKKYNHVCQVCGIKEEGLNFSVHHIDSDKKNNDVDNLTLLCQSCHNRITAKEIRRRWRRSLEGHCDSAH